LSFLQEAKRIAEKVNAFIDLHVKGSPPELYDASLHLIRAGGKRLRPFATLKFHCLYSSDEDAALPAAVALELVHNFTLIHDDIMDRDDMRHGVATVHKKFGEPLAILAGDVLFAEAYKLISETPAFEGDFRRVNQAIRLLSSSFIVLCEGQAIDVEAAAGQFYTEKQYYEMIEKKTAALFEASAAMGVLTGNGSDEDMENAKMYARNVGLAFQMVDDLLGVVGEPSVTGKPVGGDLKEGKKTLPIYLAVQRSGAQDRRLIESVWGRSDAKQEDVEAAVEVVRKLGIDRETKRRALAHIDAALSHLERMSGGDKRWLVELAHFVVERNI
jgi:geranylgeranyl diphosphate synthase type I